MPARPADDPEFYRRPPPEGRSRESAIRLDRLGRFWHDGERVDHRGIDAGLHAWIRRHPHDGRYVLDNGYDWTYFAVEGTPFFVRAIRLEDRSVTLVLSDGTVEPWIPEETRIETDGALVTRVKRSSPGGPFEATFTAHAQACLAPVLEEGDPPAVRLGGTLHAIGAKSGRFG